MYPNLYYVFKDWFNVELPFLRIFNTFGFFVAIAFIVASWVLANELKRKQIQGLLSYTTREIIVGKGITPFDLITNFIAGFIFGYKILGVLFTEGALADPPTYLLSTKGNWLFGIIIGLIVAGLKYYEINKTKLPTPEKKIEHVNAYDRVGDIVVLAFIFGFLGAKIFHNLENWSTFIKDPINALISFDGLTFYGGLIFAAIAIYIYAKKYNIAFIHLCDAMAPTLMIAYAIGRIGCQCSGDGDWGIINSAFITDASGHSITTAQQFNDAIMPFHNHYFKEGITSASQIHHIAIHPVSWLPNWMFGYTYPHNVLTDGVPIANCTGWDKFCNALPYAVFPTPFYETVVSFIFFFILIKLRSKIKTAGIMFGIYLMMNGFERFWIEKIRVNTVYNIGSFHPTQAEIISACLFVTGLLIVLNRRKSVA